MKFKTALILGLTFFSASGVYATPNLVTNPGFEAVDTSTDASGTYFVDFSGWTGGLLDVTGAVQAPPSPSGYVNSGSYAAYFAGLGGSFSQVIPTLAGHNYEVSFWYRDPPTPPSLVVKKTTFTGGPGPCYRDYGITDDASLQALFGGNQIFASDRVQDNSFPCYSIGSVPDTYTEVTSYVTGTGNDTLLFSGFNEAGTWFLDDISVTEVLPTTVPEPATVTLVIAGLAGLGAMRRRKKANLA